MSTPKDYANPTARAELRRLHADAAKGEFSAEVRRQAVNALANALPALLDALDARDALLRRCSNFIAGQAHGHHSRVAHLCEAPHRWQDCPTFMDAEKRLLADIAAAGVTQEGE